MDTHKTIYERVREAVKSWHWTTDNIDDLVTKVLLAISPLDRELAEAREERERFRRIIDDACAVTRLPNTDNDGGPADLAEEISLLKDNWNAAEAELAEWQRLFNASGFTHKDAIKGEDFIEVHNKACVSLRAECERLREINKGLVRDYNGELTVEAKLIHERNEWKARAEAAEGAIRDGIGATVTAWLGSEPAYEVTRALSLARHAAAPQPTTEGACECVGGNITKRVVAKGCPEHDTPTPEPPAVRIGHRSDCPHFPHLSLLGKTCTCDYAAVVALVGDLRRRNDAGYYIPECAVRALAALDKGE